MHSLGAYSDAEPILADREVFTGPLVSVGYSRCAGDHPAFGKRGRVSGHRFVFPRYGVWIQSRSIRYVSDPSVVEYYNDGDEFVRRPLDRRGDRTHWYRVAESVVRDIVRPTTRRPPTPRRCFDSPTAQPTRGCTRFSAPCFIGS